MGAVLVHGDGQDDAAALLELAIRVGRLDGQGAAGVGGVRLEEELEAVSSFDVLGERNLHHDRGNGQNIIPQDLLHGIWQVIAL